MRIRPYPETHQQGTILLETVPPVNYIEGDLGIQIAEDGKVWICINGIAFLRFTPKEKIDGNNRRLRQLGNENPPVS